MKQSNLLSILILFFSLLNVQCVVGQIRVPDNETGTWYCYYNDTQYQLTGGVDYSNNEYTINFTYPVNHLEYTAYLGKKASAKHPLTVKYANGNQIDYKDLKETGTSHYKFSKDIENTTSITFQSKKPTGSNQKIYLNYIHVQMAPHISLSFPTTNTYKFDKTEIGTSAKQLTVEFNSFLTKGNLIVKTNNNQFLIDGSQTSKTIASGTNILKKIGEENDTYKFTIVFHPTSENTNHQATITIYDSKDANNEYTFTVTGEGIKKTPTIKWADNKQIIYSTTLENAATSDCGTAITYTSDNEEVIKIENNKLVAVGIGFANITATTDGDGTYKSISATAQFEVTNKTLQEIVWNDIFYDLKIGSEKRSLGAYTINSETKKPNNLPITYSIENTNVVKIEDGELVIVGLGQTSITATQAGNDEYAGISRTMIVIVRENYNDCLGEYAIMDANEYATGDATWGGFNWSTIEKEYTLSTIGDKLSFVANASAGGAATGEGLKVTDQDGNVIYSRDAANISGANNLQLARTVKSLKFRINANFRISLSNILVTPAIYLEKKSNDITFPRTECGKTGNSSIDFDWANKPDYIKARIIDDASEAFSIADNTNIFGGSCGDYGTSTVKLKFNPTIQGTYTAKLALYIGGSTDAEMIIPITATAIKTTQFITWEQEPSQIKKGESYTLSATSSSGLAITYESSDENVAKIEGNVLTVLGVGDVTITASQKGNDAYEPATEETKKLIAYDDQTITWNQEFGTLRVNDQITLTATSSSGLAITYTSSNENVAKIEDDKLIVVGIGSATITASQAGNTYYTKAADITKVITSQASFPIGLTATEVGYTYANLSWSKVESATGYKIYDNNNCVATIPDGNTTNTRINLPYAETNHSISISSIFSDSESDKSNPITFTSPVYPKPNEEIVTINNITTSGFTISWGATTTATDADQPMVDYEIIFWEFDDQGNPEPVGDTAAIIDHTTNTSYTCTSLKENTAYSIFVGVRTKIKGTNEYINPITIEHADRIETYWSYNFSRTNLTTEKTKGLYFYKNNWCIVDFNEDHDITNNEFVIPTLGYPCNQIKFTANAAAWTTGNTVGVKEDETKTYNTTSWNGGAISSTNNTGETNINPKTKTVSIFKNSGTSTSASKLKVRNIILEIAPHILLNGTEDVVIDQDASTATSSKASINFEEITIGQESNEVNIDFKSFLASGNITATLSDNKNFKINNLTNGVVAQNNTLEQLEINDHNFTVSFTPQEKTDDPDNRDYSATLTIKDDVNTVVINLNGKSKYRSVSIENKAIPDYYDETTYYSTITHTVTYSDADLADWLWISSPFKAEISIKHNATGTELPLTWAGNKAPDACYLLKYYDTAERAQGVVKPWKDVKNTDGNPIIEAGKGYILGVDPRDYTGYFTITYTSVNKEKNASNKNGYSGTTQDYPSASDPILSNIHLVGSGLFENAVGVNINSSDNVYFAVRAEAGSSNYYNYYFQNSVPIAPYSSFFIQYAGKYTFTTSQTIRQNAPAAFNNEKPTEYYQLNIVNEKYTDKTMILMAHNGSEGYAVGQDFFYMTQQAAGGNIANQFYSLDGDSPLSFNHRKNENQTIALGGCVKSAGEYSISLEGSNISAQSVVLYDIFTDTTVDLLSEEYNFTTEKGSLNERFIITFSFAPQTTTEIFTPIANQIIVSGNAQNCTIDNLIIGKEVMIFDVMGRLIFNEKTNNETINISLPAGTYIVRQADNWAKFAIR